MSTKADQIKAIAAFLEDPRNDERTVEDVAKVIVDSFYSMLLKPLGDAPAVIHPGKPWKDVVSGKVKHVAWLGDGLAWVVSPGDRYGYLGPLDPWMPYATKTVAKAMDFTNADGWKAGDKAGWQRRGWGKDSFRVLATSDRAVLLLQEGRERPFVEPNDNMEKLYRKIRQEPDLF